MKQTILGVNVDDVTKEEALKRGANFLNSPESHLIFTPNPEMIVKASGDKYFLKTLNRGDLNICDGAGLKIVSVLLNKSLHRIAGVDFMIDLCGLAEKKQKSIFLLGAGNDLVVEKTSANLKLKFPALDIAGKNRGPAIREINGELLIEKIQNQNLIDEINDSKAEILFVAFGMGKQEKWLTENIAKLPGVKIGMGVGGSFDYISGITGRAPLLLRRLGLEWAYRLYKEPKRLGRIYNATIKFTILFLKNIFV